MLFSSNEQILKKIQNYCYFVKPGFIKIISYLLFVATKNKDHHNLAKKNILANRDNHTISAVIALIYAKKAFYCYSFS